MKGSAEVFGDGYFAARQEFRDGVRRMGGRLDSLAIDARGPSGEDLSIDIGWFGSSRPKRVLLHSSGIHGVEGFAGSAIQRTLLGKLPRIPSDGTLVLTHALNPFGMAWLRRVNENNVDLNRNFLEDGSGFCGSPQGYRSLETFLNPPSPPSRDLFRARAAWLIFRHGLPALKQAIAGGQYEYPRGLFFGGRDLQQSPAAYRRWVSDNLSTAQRVLAIDVHTGLGKPGEDTLMTETGSGAQLERELGVPLAPLNTDAGVAYQTRGGLQGMLTRSLPQAMTGFVCQEFGTQSPLKVLHVLREENRWHHFGSGSPDHPSKRALRLAFCPDKESWRTSVLERGQALLARAAAFLFGG